MNVAVVGAKGMLGSDLVEACAGAGLEVVGVDLPELDITRFNDVRSRLPPADCVVNCAGYTNVDEAEKHRDQAFAVNADGALSVARVCARRAVRVLHVSTDYVFDGRKTRPYTESDYPNPLSVYGASKLAGEKAVRAEGGKYLVIRTQSLFGTRGPSFVKSVVKRLRESDEPLSVVTDQVSAPTYTRHLADAIVKLIKLDRDGIVHVAASGSCSWFAFARAIVARVKPGAAVREITSQDLSRPAPRPAYSVLDTSRYASWTGEALPPWEQGLEEYLAEEGYT